MNDHFVKYIVSLYQNVPSSVYECLAIVFCLGAVILLAFCGMMKGLRYLYSLLLMEYIVLLFCSTVVFRAYSERRGHDFRPFWNYEAFLEGGEKLLPEIVMNVAVFVPVGLLLGCSFRRMKWWKVMMMGICVSGSIEVMQFVYKRGFAEVDDVLHNTLGCMIGFGLFSIVRYGYERINKRNMGVL